MKTTFTSPLKAAMYGILLATITVSASTVSFTQSAHAESFAQRFSDFFNNRKTTPSKSVSTSDATKLQLIISRGDSEINRRLQTLSKLNSLIAAAAHLSDSNKAALTAEVNSTVSGLTTLKAKLDADTNVTDARADAQSIFTEYRVYALVVPKIHLIKLADDIQATDAKLTTVAGKLQTRIDADKTAGKDVSELETKMTDLNAQIAAGQNIAANVETKIASLQPTDYNNDHKILSGYNAQLRTARSDNQAAYTDAKAIVNALKTL